MRREEVTPEDFVQPPYRSSTWADTFASALRPSVRQIAQPLITFSNALRQGGNTGAHIDLARTTDRVTAEATLDLIYYIYMLPGVIEQLKTQSATS